MGVPLTMVVRNMGTAGTRETMRECALRAEAAGVERLWVTDHIAIPKEESEGSGGRYLDPLASLAFLAGATTRIGLGVGVLVLPYRPALVTAKWIASIQELSGGRLVLGVGVGWMEAEFRAMGVDARRRGAITDDTLGFFSEAFSRDEVEANGQRFLFLPRPTRPPILVGGAARHAFPRIVAHGDGWMPGRMLPEDLAEPVAALGQRMAEAGKPPPEVVVLTALPLQDLDRCRDRIQAYGAAGATGIAHFTRYETPDEFSAAVDALAVLGAG